MRRNSDSGDFLDIDHMRRTMMNATCLLAFAKQKEIA